jgi:hypothetical protein
VAQAERDYATARALHTESLVIERELGNKRGIAHALGSLAVIDLAEQRAQRAALLFGAAESLRASIDVPLPPGERDEHDRAVAAARCVLGEQAFAAGWAKGRAMTPEQAIACALGEVSSG